MSSIVAWRSTRHGVRRRRSRSPPRCLAAIRSPPLSRQEKHRRRTSWPRPRTSSSSVRSAALACLVLFAAAVLALLAITGRAHLFQVRTLPLLTGSARREGGGNPAAPRLSRAGARRRARVRDARGVPSVEADVCSRAAELGTSSVAAPAVDPVLAPQQPATVGGAGVVAVWPGNGDAGGELGGGDERRGGAIAEPRRQLSRDRSGRGAERADGQARRW